VGVGHARRDRRARPWAGATHCCSAQASRSAHGRKGPRRCHTRQRHTGGVVRAHWRGPALPVVEPLVQQRAPRPDNKHAVAVRKVLGEQRLEGVEVKIPARGRRDMRQAQRDRLPGGEHRCAGSAGEQITGASGRAVQASQPGSAGAGRGGPTSGRQCVAEPTARTTQWAGPAPAARTPPSTAGCRSARPQAPCRQKQTRPVVKGRSTCMPTPRATRSLQPL
jgi:hypothetical protein